MDVRYEVESAIRRAAGTDGMEHSVVEFADADERRQFALRALVAATEARRKADQWIEWMADEAKAAGASWQQIGDAHGVSRQWAHKRFGH